MCSGKTAVKLQYNVQPNGYFGKNKFKYLSIHLWSSQDAIYIRSVFIGLQTLGKY